MSVPLNKNIGCYRCRDIHPATNINYSHTSSFISYHIFKMYSNQWHHMFFCFFCCKHSCNIKRRTEPQYYHVRRRVLWRKNMESKKEKKNTIWLFKKFSRQANVLHIQTFVHGARAAGGLKSYELCARSTAWIPCKMHSNVTWTKKKEKRISNKKNERNMEQWALYISHNLIHRILFNNRRA